MTDNQSTQLSIFKANLRNGIWILGIPSWVFGVADRSLAAFADSYISAVELAQLFMTAFFLVSWIYLKPEHSFNLDEVGADNISTETALCPVQARMSELRSQHMISQEYILPFSYICQIYHLLNLKHLENVHSFSLNNLRILQVTEFQPTAIGGSIKFQTILESPFNALRIWRQPIVEVILTLHTPYTVELNIPAYNGKRIIVMFHVQPLNDNEHKLFIEIYSDLKWPKPLLQILFHFAACLTLFEDLPYLRKLAERKLHRLLNLRTISSHETMLLFRRFVELYGSLPEPAQPVGLLE